MPITPIGIFFVSGIDSISNFYYNTSHKEENISNQNLGD